MTTQPTHEALNIRLVHGWSIHLFQQQDPTLRWKATATNFNRFACGVGVDAEMALANVARETGIADYEMLQAFGIG